MGRSGRRSEIAIFTILDITLLLWIFSTLTRYGEGDDIVRSLSRDKAGLSPGYSVTTYTEHIRFDGDQMNLYANIDRYQHDNFRPLASHTSAWSSERPFEINGITNPPKPIYSILGNFMNLGVRPTQPGTNKV